jgi:hypothetical protein
LLKLEHDMTHLFFELSNVIEMSESQLDSEISTIQQIKLQQLENTKKTDNVQNLYGNCEDAVNFAEMTVE